MPQNEFQIGDVVKLKCSDQKFVVYKVENNMIECVMWDVDSKRMIPTSAYDYRLFTKVE